MSARTAAILIAVFCLGAIALAGYVMGGAGVEFAIVGLVIAVVCAAIGIIWPAMAQRKKPKP